MKGPDYTDVWYGEFCIIDTPNKNDPDNGKVFQRGVDYTHVGADSKHDGGAIYVGQIVGPASGTPFMQLGTLEEVLNHSKRSLDTSVWEERTYPYATGNASDPVDVYFDKSNSNEDEEICALSSDIEKVQNIKDIPEKIRKEFMVPGKEYLDGGGVRYNDDIKYTWCNIRTSDEENDSWYYVGFQTPYPIIEFKTISKYPYNSTTDLYDGSAAIWRSDRPDDTSPHNFYREFTFQVPRGVKGDSFSGFRKVTLTGSEQHIYNLKDVSYDSNGTIMTVKVSTFNPNDASHKGKTVLLYDISTFVHTDNPRIGTITSGNSTQPDKISIYLTDYNEINKATATHDGTVTLITNNNTKIQIMDVKDPTKPFHIKFLDDVKLSTDDKLQENKRIHLLYNTDNPDNNIATDDGSNYYLPIGSPVNYIQEVVIDRVNYHLYVLYNDPEHRLRASDLPVSTSSSSDVTIVDIKDSAGNTKTDINDCNIFEDGAGITWRRRLNLTGASEGIKEILHWDSAAGQYKTGITDDEQALIDDTFWRDYYSVKDQAGVLIGLNRTHEEVLQGMEDAGLDLPDIPDDPGDPAWHGLTNRHIVEWLNIRYPGGLTGENTGDGSLSGKIVCIGNEPFDKRMYAYDYTSDTWFFLGKTNENDMYDAKMLSKAYSDIVVPGPDTANVTVHGLIFLNQSDPQKPEGVPKFWENSFSWEDDNYRWIWHYFHEFM